MEMEPGSIVTGTVVDIDNDWVVVHAGLKSEGVIPRSQFLNETGEFSLTVGDQVQVAMEARDLLQAEGIGTRVVSMPCMELFEAQDEGYRRKVLPSGAVRVAVEAGVRQGWDRWLMGERGREAKADFVGMDSFGGSAPAPELYEHFGITAAATAAKVKALL